MKVINLLILLISSYLFYLGMINIEKIAISIPLTTLTTLPIAISLDKLFTKREITDERK